MLCTGPTILYLQQLHILTALRDSTRSGQIPVLPVHVVSSTAGVIAQPNAKVLYSQGGLLIHLELDKRIKEVKKTISFVFHHLIILKLLREQCRKFCQRTFGLFSHTNVAAVKP